MKKVLPKTLLNPNPIEMALQSILLPQGLVSNHPKSAWIGGNEEDGGKLKRMDDARFSLFDTDYEIKPSEVVIFC